MHARSLAGLFVVSALVSTSAVAEPKQVFANGNKLDELCQQPADVQFVRGYVAGAIETNTQLVELQVPIGALCVPNGVTGTQVADVVCRYVRDNPQERQFSAAVVSILALRKSFPCP